MSNETKSKYELKNRIVFILSLCFSITTSCADRKETYDTDSDMMLDMTVNMDGMSPDQSPASQDMSVNSETDGVIEKPHRDAPANTKCTEDFDCRRGFFCGSAGVCAGSPNCANDIENGTGFYPDKGCLVRSNESSSVTAKECENDEDCASLPYGKHCLLQVCTDQDPCENDSDCSGEDQTCLAGVCADP